VASGAQIKAGGAAADEERGFYRLDTPMGAGLATARETRPRYGRENPVRVLCHESRKYPDVARAQSSGSRQVD